jgi:hypothetical protein
MDAFEILSTVRNMSGLHESQKIGTPEVMRYINKAMGFISQYLLETYKNDLIKTIDVTIDNSAGTELFTYINKPGDCQEVISVLRSTETPELKVCTIVDIRDKILVGQNVNYPMNRLYPYAVDEGPKIAVFPRIDPTAVAGQTQTYITNNLRLSYWKRTTDLVFSKGKLRQSQYDDTTRLTLGYDGKVRDDIYNDYDVALYNDSDGQLTCGTITKCTDYVGRTKEMALQLTYGEWEEMWPGSPVDIWYALIPIIPEAYHNFIVDAALIELAKADYISRDRIDPRADYIDLQNRLNGVLSAFGKTVNPDNIRAQA